MPGRPFSFFYFKGTPSREEHKQSPLYGATSHWHRTATVQCNIGTVQLLYGPVLVHCTLMIVTVDRRRPAKENVRQSRSPYSSCTGTPGTVQQLYRDTDDHKNCTRPVEADSTVVKTLGTVLCSSCDGVPLKLKKENGRPGSFKIPND